MFNTVSFKFPPKEILYNFDRPEQEISLSKLDSSSKTNNFIKDFSKKNNSGFRKEGECKSTFSISKEASVDLARLGKATLNGRVIVDNNSMDSMPPEVYFGLFLSTIDQNESMEVKEQIAKRVSALCMQAMYQPFLLDVMSTHNESGEKVVKEFKCETNINIHINTIYIVRSIIFSIENSTDIPEEKDSKYIGYSVLIKGKTKDFVQKNVDNLNVSAIRTRIDAKANKVAYMLKNKWF